MSREEKPAQMARSPPNRSAVHRLHEVAEPDHVRQHVNIELEQRQQSSDSSDPISIVQSCKNLHTSMNERSEKDLYKTNFQGRSSSYHGRSTWVGVGGHLWGTGFTLRVRNQDDAQDRKCAGRIRREDSAPFMETFDNTSFQAVKDSGIHLMFHIELERPDEVNQDQNGFNLQLAFSTKLDQDVDYLVLQQEAGSTQWQDITDKCKTKQGSREVEIPVRKSSRIWVIRLKSSLGSIKHALLALIHRQVLLHILVYYLKKPGKVKVRIIGISEELYQNPKKLKTAITVAEEEKFLKGEECVPKQLLKKGSLTLEFYKSSERMNVGKFDIGRSTTDKHAEWHDCSFDVNDLKDKMEVKVIDNNGNVQWSIDLNEIINDDEPVEQPAGNIEQPAVSVAKPEIESFDDEVCEHHIPWLAQRLNRDVEKVAMLLKVDSAEIDAIKQGESVETRNIRILKFWRKRTLSYGNRPTWNDIKTVLENETVGRFDVIRALFNKGEVSDDVLLWVAHRVAAFIEDYARVLDVPDFEINMCSRSFGYCEEKCFAVLQRWRQRTRTPRVEDLIQALEHDIIQENKLAQEMRETFCER